VDRYDDDDEGRVGTILDDAYELVRLIQAGGMSQVYEALEMRLSRPVAVKIMSTSLSDDEQALARFQREVKITSQLAHPHVVQLLNFGTTDTGEPYLVTEYLQGENLEQRLGRVEQVPPASAARMVQQVASALAAVHARGIVHRDLKPSNLFLLSVEGAEDFVKVMDFGVSKIRGSNTRLTRAFTMVGTPEYMSPEQAEGRIDDVDQRSDQWALGCIAWRLLTGVPPFRGRNLDELVENIICTDPPSLADVAPDLPIKVEPVLRKALSKRRSSRYATVTAFARAFASALRPVRALRSRR
jgi:eukaryotic-like serine/threonine-protein kinase